MIRIRSIKGRLLGWIFLSISSIVCIFGYYLHHEFRSVVLDSVDRTLHSKLQLVKGLMHDDGHDIEFEVEEIILGEYVIPRSGHYYQIFINGQPAIASDSLLDESINLRQARLQRTDEKAQEWIYEATGPAMEPLRVIRHEFEFMDKNLTILVAESLSESLTMLERITRSFLLLVPIMIVTVGGVGFFIATRSLKPLRNFTTSIENITHKTLDARIDNELPARELTGLADSFNSLMTRLQLAFQAEKKLIADAAHELKTPLAVINAQCDISLLKKRSSDEYMESLREVKAVGTVMLKKINCMLTLTRLDSGMISGSDFTTISPALCIVDALTLLSPLAEKSNVTINTDSSPHPFHIMGNRETLTEAISNIIENAIRYNKKHGWVRIETTRETNHLKIIIRDSGIGIDEKDHERIFDRFYRSQRSRSTEGSGLGLSIAKAVIEAHHGSITVAADPEGGSCFTIWLPIQHTPA